jgi:hypothetical protein
MCHVPHAPHGGFLIRVANFAHLDNQSDSEKKKNAIQKPSARNDQLRVFLVHRRRREFSSATQELQSGQFGLGMGKMVHIKPILCVFAKLFYSSGYTAPEMHHQQANVFQTARAGDWPVWLIWQVPAAALMRSRRQDEPQKLLVSAGN